MPASIVPDYNLEIYGEPCPYPAVATLEAMQSLKAGEVLEVITDCSQSINNIPNDAKNYGYEVLEVSQQGVMLRFLLKK